MAIKKIIDTEAKSVTFNFGEDQEPLGLSLNDLPEEIVTHLALHGLSQKGGDSYAGKADEAPQHVAAIFDQLKEGNWTSRASGSGGPRVTQLATAISTVLGIELNEVVEKLAGMEAEQRKAISNEPKVAAELARIKAEAAAKRQKELAEAASESEGEDLSQLFG